MKKILVLLVLCLLCFASCFKESEYVVAKGDYCLTLKSSQQSYDITLTVLEDMSAKLTFSEDSRLSGILYEYFSQDNTIKRTDSLGNTGESKNENVQKIFDFLLGNFENVSEVTSSNISGVKVSVLTLTDGTKLYSDSKSGAPLRMEYRDVTVDVISRP